MVSGLVFLLLAGVVLVARNQFSAHDSTRRVVAAPVGRWTEAPDLPAIRGGTVAVALKDGRGLVVGGGVGSVPIGATALWDPRQARWSHGGDLHQPRRAHAAVVLQDGRVLVAGGLAGSRVLASTEVYDPAGNTWTEVQALHNPRFNLTLTLLTDGRVLAAGGGAPGQRDAASFSALASAEVFDPAKGTWADTNPMQGPRSSATATLLRDGRVLLTGGVGSNNEALATAELFDPAIDGFVRAGTMAQARQGHTATLLGDGQVLVAGGSDRDTSLTSAELFTPGTGAWRTTVPMAQPRVLQAASLLADGRVLVTGGEVAQPGSRSSLKSAEIYDLAAGAWRPAASMSCARSAQAQLTLEGGVLVAGGDAAFPGEPPRAQSCTEVYSAT